MVLLLTDKGNADPVEVSKAKNLLQEAMDEARAKGDAGFINRLTLLSAAFHLELKDYDKCRALLNEVDETQISGQWEERRLNWVTKTLDDETK